MQPFLQAVYRVALALWVGGIAMYSFVVTPVIFRTQGRDVAARVVGAVFPLYFRVLLAAALVAFLARVASGGAFAGLRASLLSGLVLAGAAVAGYQAFRLTPAMERVKASVPSFEAAAPDDPARRAFARLHGASMALNLFLLADGAVLLVAAGGWKR